MKTRDPGLQPERTTLAWRRTFLAMLVSNFFIWRAWATSLTHHNGHIEGSSLSLGLAAAVAAAATAVLGACILQRNASLRDRKAPETLLLGTATTAIVVVGVTTITSILLGG
ncbi:DUF202 domain-containing protein [Arthrobacter sp. SLBN-112]|uniref:DUF202 domain-containing protein n=1 Tax=Arthrobacter sp. SLBN-112 TaxID=2768452 RepID=UPI0027AF2CD8|nr:DUF202 domain-containing protein [Arthrobacter sp. SLBN-112]MDQ0801468.1 uncharacterized membrane protein YidH (DUF202 family) [Arthrobacter sp. SLBN-112]